MNLQNIKKIAASIGFAMMIMIGVGMINNTQAQCVRRPVPLPAYYPNQPYFGGVYNNGGYNYQGYYPTQRNKGYRDGLDRGREDARDHRYPNPNNSEHFRNGNQAYREGFQRGYNAGYHQYTRYRR